MDLYTMTSSCSNVKLGSDVDSRQTMVCIHSFKRLRNRFSSTIAFQAKDPLLGFGHHWPGRVFRSDLGLAAKAAGL